ncbi:hypothetical protein J4479_00025 [Candidatus Woesearchaeota archaeon]|nr:hypothetical protein [Candidatus Woesearchaeota archaeon]
MDICIKNINKNNWLDFKSESLKHGLHLGELFNEIINEHLKRCTGGNWEKVLYGEKKCKGILSLADLKKIRSEFREKISLRN